MAASYQIDKAAFQQTHRQEIERLAALLLAGNVPAAVALVVASSTTKGA